MEDKENSFSAPSGRKKIKKNEVQELLRLVLKTLRDLLLLFLFPPIVVLPLLLSPRASYYYIKVMKREPHFGGEKYAEVKKSVGIGTYVGLFGGVDHLSEIGGEQRSLPSLIGKEGLPSPRKLNQGNQEARWKASLSCNTSSQEFHAKDTCSISKANGLSNESRTRVFAVKAMFLGH